MSSGRQDGADNMDNLTLILSMVDHVDPDFEGFGFNFPNTDSSFLGFGNLATDSPQSSIQSFSPGLSLMQDNFQGDEAATNLPAAKPANFHLGCNGNRSNPTQHTGTVRSHVALPLENQANSTQRQSLLSGNGNASNNLGKSDFLAINKNASYQTNNILSIHPNASYRANNVLNPYFLNSFLYPDPITTLDHSVVPSYNYDFVASSAMNPSTPHAPHHPSRFHNLGDRIEDHSAPFSASPTPSTDNEILSSSPTPETYAQTTPDLVDEGEDAEEECDDDTHFTTLAEARQWQLLQQKKTKSNKDKTLPADEEKRAFVAKLVSAFGYMGPEALKNKDGTKRCADVTASHITHSLTHPKAVEALCWNLLEETIRRCEGKPLSAVYAPLKSQMKEATFANRIKGVIKALKVSKNLCKHLFEPPFASRVIDDPWNEIRKVQRNVTNNKRKHELMKKGMRVQEVEEAEEGAEGAEGKHPMEEDETDSDDGEPHPKRSHHRRSKKA